MNYLDRALVRNLALVLILKLVFLAGLWWIFVRDQRTAVDGDSVAAQFLQNSPNPAQGTSP